MSKHTPGPWIAAGAWVEHPRDDVPDICSCSQEAICQSGRSYSEQMANAQLIAAAPEMLRALKAIVREYVKHGRQHWPEFANARAAISKAEGQQ